MASQYLYGFSIASVQKYLLSASTLRDIQGGSQLLEELCQDVFRKAVKTVGLDEETEIVSQAASGARVLSDKEGALRALLATWPIVVDQFAPGAVLEQALVSIAEMEGESESEKLQAAHRMLGSRMKSSRSFPAVPLPVAGPLVKRARLTGRPAVGTEKVGNDRIDVDRATKKRIDKWRAVNDKQELTELDERFLHKIDGEKVRFAGGGDFLEDGLVTEKDTWVAVIHADGNAIGSMVKKVLSSAGQDPSRELQEFSDGLSDATRNAARQAVEKSLQDEAKNVNGIKVLPSRPIVLGGDDVTIITRGDLGIRFAEAFLNAFEGETQKLTEGGLSACAGVALVKQGFPFDRAHDLAESLCKLAKSHAKQSKDGPHSSALSFYRSTTSLSGSAENLFSPVASGEQVYHPSFGAYAVGKNPVGMPTLEALRTLAAAIPGEQKGAYRELMSTIQARPAKAQEAFNRACGVLRQREEREKEKTKDKEERSGAKARQVKKVKDALMSLTGKGGGDLWKELDAAPDGTAEVATPVGDAFVLGTIENIWGKKDDR